MCVICTHGTYYYAIALVDASVLGYITGCYIVNISFKKLDLIKNTFRGTYSPFINIDDRFIK